MITRYKAIIKDTPRGIDCRLYGFYFFWWVRLDRFSCTTEKADRLINEKIDWWDKLFGSGGILIEQHTKNFKLRF